LFDNQVVGFLSLEKREREREERDGKERRKEER
jgi:hypothetical protein